MARLVKRFRNTPYASPCAGKPRPSAAAGFPPRSHSATHAHDQRSEAVRKTYCTTMPESITSRRWRSFYIRSDKQPQEA